MKEVDKKNFSGAVSVGLMLARMVNRTSDSTDLIQYFEALIKIYELDDISNFNQEQVKEYLNLDKETIH